MECFAIQQHPPISVLALVTKRAGLLPGLSRRVGALCTGGGVGSRQAKRAWSAVVLVGPGAGCSCPMSVARRWAASWWFE